MLFQYFSKSNTTSHMLATGVDRACFDTCRLYELNRRQLVEQAKKTVTDAKRILENQQLRERLSFDQIISIIGEHPQLAEKVSDEVLHSLRLGRAIVLAKHSTIVRNKVFYDRILPLMNTNGMIFDRDGEPLNSSSGFYEFIRANEANACFLYDHFLKLLNTTNLTNMWHYPAIQQRIEANKDSLIDVLEPSIEFFMQRSLAIARHVISTPALSTRICTRKQWTQQQLESKGNKHLAMASGYLAKYSNVQSEELYVICLQHSEIFLVVAKVPEIFRRLSVSQRHSIVLNHRALAKQKLVDKLALPFVTLTPGYIEQIFIHHPDLLRDLNQFHIELTAEMLFNICIVGSDELIEFVLQSPALTARLTTKQWVEIGKNDPTLQDTILSRLSLRDRFSVLDKLALGARLTPTEVANCFYFENSPENPHLTPEQVEERKSREQQLTGAQITQLGMGNRELARKILGKESLLNKLTPIQIIKLGGLNIIKNQIAEGMTFIEPISYKDIEDLLRVSVITAQQVVVMIQFAANCGTQLGFFDEYPALQEVIADDIINWHENIISNNISSSLQPLSLVKRALPAAESQPVTSAVDALLACIFPEPAPVIENNNDDGSNDTESYTSDSDDSDSYSSSSSESSEHSKIVKRRKINE